MTPSQVPVIVIQPVGQTASVGDAATFTVTASGAGTLTYLWFKNNLPLMSAGSVRAYTTPPVTPAMNGTTYKVTVANSSGSVTSASATLTVAANGQMVWKKDLVYLGGKEVAEVDPSGLVHTTLVDHLGSPRLVVNAAGAVESEQKYLPFGEQLDASGSLKTLKGYTNHEQTDPSGLIYMQARFYAPMYHRFLSPDPARDQHFEETQSWNIYSYVQNNPIKNIDTNGMLLQDAMFNGLANAKHMEKMTDKQKQQFVKDWKTANVVGGAGGVAALAALEVGPAAVAVGGSWFSRQVDKVGAFFSNLMGGGPAVKDEVQAAVRGLQQGAEAVQKISSTGLLKVTESEGGVFMGEFQAAKGAAQVAGEAHIENGTLTLKGLDIAGKGTLKEAVALATQIGEKLGMNKVVLEMAKRTTGANPGHVPKPIEIAINR